MTSTAATQAQAAGRQAAGAQSTKAAAPDSSTLAPGLRLLPRDLRSDVYRLYGVLRVIDDLVDHDRPEAEQHVAALEHWAQGQPAENAGTGVLSDLTTRYALSPELFAEFAAAMRHDMARGVLATEEEVESYCQRVGGTVAIALAQIIGTLRPDGPEKIATLARAMHRAHILRDLDEDLQRGRVYVARTAIHRFGAPTPGAREALLRDQIARADRLFEEGLAAMPILTRWQTGFALSVTLYREILRQIEREGFGRRGGRVVVPPWRTVPLIARCRLTALVPARR